MRVCLSLGVTLLNREVYTSNILLTKRRVEYSITEREHGYTDIISIPDLLG